jgi:hypothetical protein
VGVKPGREYCAPPLPPFSVKWNQIVHLQHIANKNRKMISRKIEKTEESPFGSLEEV